MLNDYERLQYLIKFYEALAVQPINGPVADTRTRVRKEIEKYLGVESKEDNS